MKIRRRLSAAAALPLLVAALPGCAPQCGATEARLASLRRGMTTQEVEAVMGCPGYAVPLEEAASPGYALYEWDGPRLLPSIRTRAAFQDDRLLFVYGEGRGGLDPYR